MRLFSAIEQILFPRFCINCKREGSFLCEDCFFLVEVMEKIYCLCDYPKTGREKCKKCCQKKLDGLLFASYLKGPLAENLFKKYTQEPFLKDLSYPLAGLVIRYFLHLQKIPKNFSLHTLPVKNERIAGYDINKEVAEKIVEPLNIKKGKNIIIFSLLYTEEVEEEARRLKEKGVKKVKAVCVFRK